MIEKLEGILIRKLNNRVLQRPYLLEHLVGDLWVEAHGAVLELVEGGVEGLVYSDKFLFQSLQLAFVL